VGRTNGADPHSLCAILEGGGQLNRDSTFGEIGRMLISPTIIYQMQFRHTEYGFFPGDGGAMQHES